MSELSSRQEYLKRYLDGYESKSKKKKIKPKNSHKQSRLKIVDEDIDINKIEVPNDVEFGDEVPLVVDVIDERPDHVKISEIYSSTLWKKLDNSLTGAETGISSHSESKDSSEFKNSFSNQASRKEQNIQLKPQGKQNYLKCVQSEREIATDFATKTTKSHSARHLTQNSTKHSLDNVTYALTKQIKDEFHPTKSADSSSNKNRVKEAHDSGTSMSPSIDRSKEIHSVKSSERANEYNSLHDSDRDFSPVRRQISQSSHEMLEHYAYNDKAIKREHDSDDDLSPPRGRTVDLSVTAVHNTPESKNLPKLRHDLDSDISSPRTKISDLSDSDLSPPRNKVDSQHHKQRDFSPPRKNAKHSSEGFSESPKKNRNKVQHSSDSDFSPPRERVASASSVNKSKSVKRRHDSDEDNSLSGGRPQNSPKSKNMLYSPCRSSPSPKPKEKSHRREQKVLQETLASGDSDLKRKRPASTLSGMKAGLQDSATLREETRNFRDREKATMNELSDELSGRNAETISRDKDTGRRRNLKEEKLRQKEEEKVNVEKQEKYLEWGKGLKQKDDQQKRLQEDMYEMSKPLARYADDEDLERELKSMLHEGDPMLEFIKRKKQKNQPTAASLLLYQGPPPPPNRFNIQPGYRWDGVDRSNGFEKKYFEKINSTKAKEHEAYLWSVENM